MNPLELLTQLFVKGYGVPPDVAARQAAQLINKPDDPLTAQALEEAKRMDAYNRYTPQAAPPTKSFAPENFKGLHVKVAPLPAAPLPITPAAPTPDHAEDANISAWQRYSDILKTIEPAKPSRDMATGGGIGKRK